MAQPRTFIISNNQNEKFIERTASRLHEEMDQDVVFVDGSGFGDSNLVIQSGTQESTRDPLAVSLTGAVIGGVGATLGEIVIEWALEQGT